MDVDKLLLPESRASLLDFFAKSLTSFQDSQDAFQVVCTLSADEAAIPLPPRPTRPSSPIKELIILDSSFNPPTLAHMELALSAARSYAGGSSRVLLLLSVKNADKAPQPAGFPHRLAMMYLFGADLLQRVRAERGQQQGGTGEDRGVDVDLGLSTLPYFSDKCEVIAESGHYAEGGGGSMEQVFLAGYDTLIRIFNPKYYGPAAPAPPSTTTTTTTTTSTSAEATTTGGQDQSTTARPSMKSALGPFFQKARLRIKLRAGDQWGSEAAQREYLQGLADGGLEEVGGMPEWAGRVDLIDGSEAGVGGEVVSSTLVRQGAREGDRTLLGRLLTSGVREWVLEEGLYAEEKG